MKAPKLFYNTEPKNLLPGNGKLGEAIYHGPIFDWEESEKYLEILLHEIPFRPDERVIFDKHIITKRLYAWYDHKKKWPRVLIEIKKKVEEIAGTHYDICLLNFYPDGTTGMGWHSDEEDMREDSDIASLSFGEERRFDFRSIDKKEKYSIVLEHGALLLMRGWIQKYWQHHVPPSKRILGPRINLTFRKKK
jgi:hypothetical protein